MDEAAFRQTRGTVNPQPCVFEGAMLARCCACTLAAWQNIAEREAVACGSTAAREQCAMLRALLRQKSAFALKLTQLEGPLPHSKEIKVECGGLLGVQLALARQAVPSVAGLAAEARGLPAVADVHSLVLAAQALSGDLSNLPYSTIVQSVVAYQIRHRRLEH
jgi:hypothetical protein